MAGVLTDLAATRPVLIVLDDLHTADPGSLSLLHHLVRTSQARRWRFIATSRDDGPEPDGLRRRVLDGILRQGMAVEVDLLRLSRADCAGLAAAAAAAEGRAEDRRNGSRVFRLSLGNPLFAIELTSSPETDLERMGPLRRTTAEPAGDAVPDSIRRLVGGRLARLPADARRILAALSVAGGAAVPLGELESVAAAGLHPPMDGPAVTSALDAAVLSGIVEERDVVIAGRPVLGHAFRHPLVRLACADGLSRAARRRLHRAYADAVLRLRPGAVDLIAFHLAVADDVRAPGFLRTAADRAAALYANDSACDYYRELVAHLEPVDLAGAAEARLAWGEVLRRAAHYPEAEEVLRRSLTDLVAAGRQPGALRAAVCLAEVLGRAGRPDEGLDVLRNARVDSRSAAADRVARQLAVGALNFHAGRYEDALPALHRAELETAGMPVAARRPLLSRLFTIRAACLLVSGRIRECRGAAEESLRTAEECDDAALISSALSVVGELAREEGRLDAARDCARRAVSMARRTGDPTVLAFDQSNLAGAELLLGDHERAAALATAAVRLARSLGSSWVLPYALVGLAEVELRRGRLDGAQAALSECDEAMSPSPDPQVLDGMRRLTQELAEARTARAAARP